jgi:hypothetical protein
MRKQCAEVSYHAAYVFVSAWSGRIVVAKSVKQ